MLDSDISKGWVCTDFEFVSFCVAAKTPDGKHQLGRVIGIQPWKGRVNAEKFQFVLRSDALPSGGNVVTYFDMLQMKFVNGDCLVDPVALSGARRNLRAMLDQNKKAAREDNK